MKTIGLTLAFIALFPAAAIRASQAWGSINNFDAVNDTGVECHGFEIELDDCNSTNITYTYNYNHYGVPVITVDSSVPAHPKTFVRYESKKNPDGSWAAYTAIPTGPISPTQGHQFTNPALNFGGEHFGAGFTAQPTSILYHWLVDDGKGSLIRGGALQVSTPSFSYAAGGAGAAGQVQAVIAPPPPPAPPPLEFGKAVWVKEIRTTSHSTNKIKLRELVTGDPGDPNAKDWANGEPDEVEVEWQVLQKDYGAPDGGAKNNVAAAAEPLQHDGEVVTRRYEFYKYLGPLDNETGEALAETVGTDGIHGKGTTLVNGVSTDLSTLVVVGDYTGSQMAAVDVKAPVGLIEHVSDGEAGVPYVARAVVVQGALPFTCTQDGNLPAGMSFDTATGILSGTPTESGVFQFHVTASDGTNPDVAKNYLLQIAAAGAVRPPSYTLDTTVAVVGTGSTDGDGVYAVGANAIVTATPSPGMVFQNWTDNGQIVSTDPMYALTMDVNHSLVATFSSKCTITTSAAPAAGGTIAGDGTVDVGSNVNLTATPHAGFAFANWTEGGNVVSSSASYSFSAAGNRTLVANFTVSAATVTVDATAAAANIGAYSADVGATVTSAGETATWVIEYGPTTAYGKTTPAQAVALNTAVQATLTLSPLAGNTKYYYRCKATGSKTGVVRGPSLSFTTLAPVAMAAPNAPVSDAGTLVAVGDTVNLSLAGVTGSTPYSFQWRKNGVAVGAAGSAPSLGLVQVNSAAGGTWTCVASNPGSHATSPGLLLTVATLTPFTQAALGGTASASVTLSPASPGATYLWKQAGAGGLPPGMGTVTGASGSKLTLHGTTTAAAFDYECDVTVGGTTKTFSLGHLAVLPKPTIGAIGPQFFKMGEPVQISVTLTDAATSSVTGLPAGLSYSAATQMITGLAAATTPVSKALNLTVHASNIAGTATLIFPLTLTPVDPSVTGSYFGLIDRFGDPGGMGGKFTLSLTSTASLTGSITLGAAVYPINARALTSTFSNTTTLTLPALRSGKNPVLNVSMTIVGGQVTGTVASATGTASITGDRNPWTSVNHTTAVGTYNGKFSPGALALGSPSYPHGTSLGTFSITSLGAVSFTVRLADGSVVTGSTTLTATGGIPVYRTLTAGGGGSILGKPVVLGNGFAGSLAWNKLASTGRAYGAGFPAQDLAGIGGLYVAPSAGQLFLGLAKVSSNAVVRFSDSTLTAGFSQPFTITGTNVPQVPANANGVTVSLTTGTGWVSGQFHVTDPNPLKAGNIVRTASWWGLAIPGTSAAPGFFLLPNLPTVQAPNVTTNAQTSGIVQMGANVVP